jgi:hypothetical protein
MWQASFDKIHYFHSIFSVLLSSQTLICRRSGHEKKAEDCRQTALYYTVTLKESLILNAQVPKLSRPICYATKIEQGRTIPNSQKKYKKVSDCVFSVVHFSCSFRYKSRLSLGPVL